MLEYAERHLDWLVANSCSGFSGLCWGLGFVHPAARGLVYDQNTPFSTITPYPLEALVRYLREQGIIAAMISIEELFVATHGRYDGRSGRAH